MTPKLRMRDYLTFQVSATEAGKKYLHECKDSKSDSGYSLLTYVDATHSGVLNGNQRFYRPDLMQASAHTWGNNKFSKKPVLLHHDRESDAMGRVVKWKYVDLRHEYTGKYSQVNNLAFYDSVSSKKMDVYSSVNWVLDNLQRKNSDYIGLGGIQLGLNVTNPDAIAKVQREEYATVSVGFTTDAAVCSICHQDWAEDGKCKHKLGQVYEDERCFLIAGNFDYEECSFVSFPADRAAVVLDTEVVRQAQDNLALRVYLLGQRSESLAPLFADSQVHQQFTDMVGSDIEVVTDNEDSDMELDAIRKEINSKELTKDRALELRTALAGLTDGKRTLASLNAKIRKNGWEDAEAASAGPSKEEIESKIATLTDKLATLATQEEKDAYVAALETDAAAFNLVVPSVEPANEKVVATDSDSALGKLKVQFKDSETGKTFVSQLEDLTATYHSLPDEEKWPAKYTLYQTYDILGDQEALNAYKSRLMEDPTQTDCLVDKEEYVNLQDAVASLEEEKTSTVAVVAGLRQANKSLVDQLRKAMATTIVMYSVQAKEAGFSGLDAAQIQTKIAERSTRQLISLQDSLKDLTEKIGFEAPVPVTDAATEALVTETAVTDSEAAVAKPIPDTTVTDGAEASSEPTTDALRGDEEEVVTIPPFATREELQTLARQSAAKAYKARKK